MRVERLDEHHELAGFGCGNKRLDDWLRNHALENQRRNLSRTFVVLDDDDSLVGYYSLAMGGVSQADLPRGLGRGLPPIDIEMVLLGRLAIDAGSQGTGLGRDVLIDALRSAVIAGRHAAARFIAVDPIDEPAASFYERFGFRAVLGDRLGRMYLRMDTAEAELSE